MAKSKAPVIPFVSCVCPTYNRRRFLPWLFRLFESQTYPADRLELVVLDDSDVSNQDLVDGLPEPLRSRVNYVHSSERLVLGRKRNMLNTMARGDIIVSLDDDDFYPPDKVSYTVAAMQVVKADISGSSGMYIYFADLKRVFLSGPFATGHATNGTLSYTRKYLATHRYEDDAKSAEEKAFMKGYTERILQLDPRRTILCIAHGTNTYDKKQGIDRMREVEVRLEDFVADPDLLVFYQSLG